MSMGWENAGRVPEFVTAAQRMYPWLQHARGDGGEVLKFPVATKMSLPLKELFDAAVTASTELSVCVGSAGVDMRIEVAPMMVAPMDESSVYLDADPTLLAAVKRDFVRHKHNMLSASLTDDEAEWLARIMTCVSRATGGRFMYETLPQGDNRISYTVAFFNFPEGMRLGMVELYALMNNPSAVINAYYAPRVTEGEASGRALLIEFKKTDTDVMARMGRTHDTHKRPITTLATKAQVLKKRASPMAKVAGRPLLRRRTWGRRLVAAFLDLVQPAADDDDDAVEGAEV
jgi:hypothetical protein